jgi:CRISPR-associated protein Csx17
MTEPIILYGCAPEPLIHYLKALGALRLIAEQLDPTARGAWLGDAFVLETSKAKDEIVSFFLNEYRPTPITGPWNGGSGFYDGDDTAGIDAILSDKSERLQDYRDTINTIFSFPELPSVGHLSLQNLIDRIEQAIGASTNKESKDVKDWTEMVLATKASIQELGDRFNLWTKTIQEIEDLKLGALEKRESKAISNLLQSAKKLRTTVKKFERSAGKDIIIQACRNRLSDRCVEWIDATVVPSERDAESPLLGSGGNDGRLDFTKAFMLYLNDVLPKTTAGDATVSLADSMAQSETRLRACLFADTVATVKTDIVGQFFPGGAGGANASQGVSGSPNINPWDFVLGIEGCLVLASAAVRQLVAGARTKASFPFTVKSSKVGYGISAKDEDVKAEIWLPLWSRFARYAEIAHIFREGRVQFSNRRRNVQTGFDFARAVAELGVDRGIESFQRFTFSRRFGKNYLAVAVGTFTVKERPRARLIHQIDNWLESFSRATSGDKVQPRFVRAQQRIEDAIFRLCESGSTDHLREVLISLGAAEAELANGEKFRDENNRDKKVLRPLSGLRLSWANECNDGSDEFRLAAALASICGEAGSSSIRENIEPVSVTEKGVEWKNKSVCAIWGNGAVGDNLAAVLHRRSIEARANSLSLPILTSRRVASLNAVNAFLNGETDDAKLEDLLRGLVLLDWQNVEPSPKPQTQSRDVPSALPRAYALLKLLFLPGGKFQRDEGAEVITIKHEPAVVPLLRARRVPDALQIAYQRLQSSGLMPATREFHYDDSEGTRLAAALLIPIDEPSIRALAELVLRDKPEDQ